MITHTTFDNCGKLCRWGAIIADRSLGRVKRWEEEFAGPSQTAQFAEQIERLSRQRYGVRLFHLHALGWNPPNLVGKVDFAPLGLAQLAGTQEHVRGQFQRKVGLRAAFIRIDVA